MRQCGQKIDMALRATLQVPLQWVQATCFEPEEYSVETNGLSGSVTLAMTVSIQSQQPMWSGPAAYFLPVSATGGAPLALMEATGPGVFAFEEAFPWSVPLDPTVHRPIRIAPSATSRRMA